jgi:DNA-binding NtrC family response regulator
MPGMTGPESFVEITAIRPDVPVVFTTGYLDEETLGPAAENSPVLQKPYGRKSLGNIIRKVLDQ